MSVHVEDGVTHTKIATDEPSQMVSIRTLAGWLSFEEATAQARGRLPEPFEDLADFKSEVAARHSAVATRAQFLGGDPIVQEDRTLLDQAVARPEVQEILQSTNGSVEWVDMRKVVSVQKRITTDGLNARVSSASQDKVVLVELCLPAAHDVAPLPVLGSVGEHGATLSSLNPNLRVYQMIPMMQEVRNSPELPAHKVQGVMVLFGIPSSYVSVVRYHGRYFLRDGYHRVAGLLKAGITTIPALVNDASTFDYVSPPKQDLFRYEVAMSGTPPLVGDFWDESVACSGAIPAVRKVVRIRADEFCTQG